MGLDPDAVVAEGKRRQRRRAGIGATVATAVVVAGAAAVPNLLVPQSTAPAAPQIEVVDPIAWPPPGMVRMTLLEGVRLKAYLPRAISRVVPDAQGITTDQPYEPGPGFGTETPATVTLRAEFRRWT
ncbi:hypothetical protein [Saccharopolyspora hirsuta]|uniref:hypothetical protein n=1 Tax=Saccharopolyspora hirsuta TaxID=1837 RepID=UPI001FE92EB9|nr:hypothetical protein [Saccharopolyspora hirsuta]